MGRWGRIAQGGL